MRSSVDQLHLWEHLLLNVDALKESSMIRTWQVSELLVRDIKRIIR